MESSLCFCGLPADVEEDSLYCSVQCAREDAMLALMGSESGSECSSRIMSRDSSASSHYRKREAAEVEKERVKAVKEGREHQTGVWRYQKGRGKGKKVAQVEENAAPPPIQKDFLPALPTRFESLRLNPLPVSVPMTRGNVHTPSASTSTTGSTAPSFSTNGSRHSFSSSLSSEVSSSMASPSLSSYGSAYGSCPRTPPPHFQFTHHQSSSINHQEQNFQFPSNEFSTPSPGNGHLEIYDSFYLEKSPTLTIVPQSKKSPTFIPNQTFLSAMFEETSLEDQEELDFVGYGGRLEGGWGGEGLKERVKVGGKHKKGGLSFDDVVSLMQN